MNRTTVISPSELRVLELVAQGYTYPEVASRLGVALSTVKTHMQRLSRRWGAHNSAHCVHLAYQRRIFAVASPVTLGVRPLMVRQGLIYRAVGSRSA